MPYSHLMDAVRKAIQILNESTAAFARRIGVQPPTVHEWVEGSRPVPPKRALQIEQETGGKVTRAELRPDDFRELWPEFAAKLDRQTARAAERNA